MTDSVKHIDPSQMSDVVSLRQVVVLLLNLVEEQSVVIKSQGEELQKFRDEINRLKGEKGKPAFKAKDKDKEGDKNQSDVEGSDKRGNNKTGSGKERVGIDRVVEMKEVGVALPPDARIRSWEDHVVQDIVLRRDTVRYRVAVWHSPSEGKTWRSQFPLSEFNSFGPNIRGLLHLLHNECNVTQGCLASFCDSLGLSISSGSIDNILKAKGEEAIAERKEILSAGIAASAYVQADSTGSKEKGVSLYTQIFCSPLFTVYFSNQTKSRLQVLQSLCGLTELSELPVCCNEDTVFLLERFGVPRHYQRSLGAFLEIGGHSTLGALKAWIALELPKLASQKITLARVLDSFALAHYFQRQDFPTLSALMSDDAPEYKLIAALHGLCWVHDARDYKKLVPLLDFSRQKLGTFMDEYWKFYRSLLDYKAGSQKPPPPVGPKAEMLPNDGQAGPQALKKVDIEAAFERIFTQKTGYDALDKLIARTYSKKQEMLPALDRPEFPLHNNAAELAARRKVRKRDVSLHTMSPLGTKVQDAYLSIIETAKKLGVSAFEYLTDFLSGNRTMVPLAQIIAQKKENGALVF
jgi:Transposase IS66 family